jgi:predicted nucleotidyltransferase
MSAQAGKSTELALIATTVAHWAAAQPLVRRAWLFGSRVRGTSRVDSDIDVAVEIRKLPGDSSCWTTFVFEGEQLADSLQASLSITLDLQWYGGVTETPTIHAGLQESAILVYEMN